MQALQGRESVGPWKNPPKKVRFNVAQFAKKKIQKVGPVRQTADAISEQGLDNNDDNKHKTLLPGWDTNRLRNQVMCKKRTANIVVSLNLFHFD